MRRAISKRLSDMSHSGHSGGDYLVPAGWHRVDETIKRSRFVTTVARANSSAAAKEIVAKVRTDLAGATHHCWAYAAGPPGDSRDIGMSDDGEPHGTAGRPMLNVLLHSEIGEIIAVCSRFYGGVKLGTGGLSRAYAGGVTAAIESLPTQVAQHLVRVRIELPYDEADAVQRFARELSIVVETVAYGAQVRLDLLVPATNNDVFAAGVRAITRGRVSPMARPDLDA